MCPESSDKPYSDEMEAKNRTMLEIGFRQLDDSLKSCDSMDSKVTRLFAAHLIFIIFILTIITKVDSRWYNTIPCVIVIILLIAGMLLSIASLKGYRFDRLPDIKATHIRHADKPINDLLLEIVAEIDRASKNNYKQIEKKARFFKWSTYLFATNICFITPTAIVIIHLNGGFK